MLSAASKSKPSFKKQKKVSPGFPHLLKRNSGGGVCALQGVVTVTNRNSCSRQRSLLSCNTISRTTVIHSHSVAGGTLEKRVYHAFRTSLYEPCLFRLVSLSLNQKARQLHLFISHGAAVGPGSPNTQPTSTGKWSLSYRTAHSFDMSERRGENFVQSLTNVPKTLFSADLELRGEGGGV